MNIPPLKKGPEERDIYRFKSAEMGERLEGSPAEVIAAAIQTARREGALSIMEWMLHEFFTVDVTDGQQPTEEQSERFLLRIAWVHDRLVDGPPFTLPADLDAELPSLFPPREPTV